MTMIQKKTGQYINPATEEKQADIISAIALSGGLTVTNIINEVGYNLYAAAFSKTSILSNPFTLKNIDFTFSTEEEKTITMLNDDGDEFWSYTTTEKSVSLFNINKYFAEGENMTVNVTQLTVAGTMSCVVTVTQGVEGTLVGNPVLAAGDNIIGKVKLNANGNTVSGITITDADDDLQAKEAVVTASAIYGRNDGKVVPIMVDKTTHNLTTIDIGHSEIHEGEHFFVKNWIDLTSGQVLDFLVITPDTAEYAHMVVEFNFENEGNVIVYEGSITSANGTLVTPMNRDRNSLNTASLLMSTAPTVTSVGNIIARYKAGSGKSIGGTERSANEIILKRNTKYLIRATNDTVSNNWMGYLADWYQHTNKN